MPQCDTTSDSGYIPKSQQGHRQNQLRLLLPSVLNSILLTTENFAGKHSGPRPRLHPPKRNNNTPNHHTLCCCRLIVTTAMSSVIHMDIQHVTPRERQVILNTDSESVGIDNHASACTSCHSGDFLGPLQEDCRAIKGFEGTTTYDVYQGTLRWTWEDDDGKANTFLIPRSYHIPQGNVRLSSPNTERRHNAIPTLQ